MGPTPRRQDIASWQPAAIELLRKAGFEGAVIIPEDAPDDEGSTRFRGDYDDQVEWEERGLTIWTVIIAYVPRDMNTMLALATNVEFGMWYSSGKLVLGSPPEAVIVRYLEYYANKVGAPATHSLEETVSKALALIAKLGASGPRIAPVETPPTNCG